jgi:hypothetical protein
MAKDTLGFVLSDETARNLAKEITELRDYQKDGWSISDIRIEQRTQDGVEFSVGIIEVEK